jgi:uncharacterized membrane protein YidH (DUF202 family)
VESILAALVKDGNVAILALLLGNVAQGVALYASWRWHRADRQEDRQRWMTEVAEGNRQLGAVVEAVTQLRLMIAQCTSFTSRTPGRR